jgi:hypothetical protein
MGPGLGWDSVVAPMGGHRVVAVAIPLVALLVVVPLWELSRAARGRYPGTTELADLFGVARSTVYRAVGRERTRNVMGVRTPVG